MDTLIICADCGEKKEHHAHGMCRECYSRHRRDENPDKVVAIKRRSYLKHREQILARKRHYYQKNRERILAYLAQWREEHREEARAYQRRYREEHEEKVKACQQRSAKRNPENRRRLEARRQAVKRRLPDTLTREEAKQILSAGRCLYCGSAEHLTLDHFVPLSKGGGTTRANMVIACESCNSKKRAKLPGQVFKQLALAV